MKVYIYSEAQNAIEKSGVGRAIYHQMQAVKGCGWRLAQDPWSADVVHINTVLPKSYFLAKKLRKAGVPLVYHAHSTKEDFRDSYVGSNLTAELFKRWIISCYSKGDVIITPTPYSRSLLEGYGIKNEIFAISNGIDLDEYVKNEFAGNKFREKYGFKSDDKVIMSAGLVIKRKGVYDFAEIARRFPQYKFIWFGDSNLGLVGKEIRNIVKNPPPNLIFAGYVNKKSLQAAFSGSDLFLFPSYEETEGIVVLEALAAKIPTLLRNIPVYEGWLCSHRGGGGTIRTLPTTSTSSKNSPQIYSTSAYHRLSKTVTRSYANGASLKPADSLSPHTNGQWKFVNSAVYRANASPYNGMILSVKQLK